MRKHTQSVHPIDRLFQQTLEEANARHCETPFHQALGPRPLVRFFHTHTLQGFIQRNNWIFEVLCQNCDIVSFLPLMLSLRVGSQFSSPASVAAFIFQRAFAFWTSCGCFTTHSPAHFFVGVVKLSPVFSFDAFVQRLTGGVPVIISQERTPPLLFLSFSMWSTLMYDFHVHTSSARSVNSSRFSLTVTSGQPSDPFGLLPDPRSGILPQRHDGCQSK